jgi:hypothetical protein
MPRAGVRVCARETKGSVRAAPTGSAARKRPLARGSQPWTNESPPPKAITMHTIVRTHAPLLLSAVLLVASACASQTRQLAPGERTPAAKAEVKIDRNAVRRTGNSQLNLDVEHLPPPAQLGDDLTTFVVWLAPQGGKEPQNLGQLNYNPSSREGSLAITTPYEQFTLWVTAERASNPIERSDHIIASGEFDLRGQKR